MKNRKYIRIALNAEDEAAFRAAKGRAEEVSGLSLSDGAFALGALRKAWRRKND